MTGVTMSEHRRQTTNLDGVGNRKTVIRDGQPGTYVTNRVNEYVYVNNQRLSYDLNGDLLDDGGHRLWYNHNNQVVKADRYTADDPQYTHIKIWQYDVQRCFPEWVHCRQCPYFSDEAELNAELRKHIKEILVWEDGRRR